MLYVYCYNSEDKTYGIKDTKDGVIEYVTYDELLHYKNLGIDIKGVLYNYDKSLLISIGVGTPAFKKDIDYIKLEVWNLVGDEYTLLDDNYINNRTKMRIVHNKCKHSYSVAMDKFLLGRRCPNCNHGIAYDTDIFKKKVLDLVGEDYTVLGEYINSRFYISMRHNKCGNEFLISPAHFIQGRRCAYCSKSLPELIMKDLVKKYYPSLVSNVRYSFLGNYELDVFIPNLKVAIEYDGYGYHINKYESDVEKCKRCSDVGIRLIRVREYGLPSVAQFCDEIRLEGYLSLTRYENIKYFTNAMNNLLNLLGIFDTSGIDYDLVRHYVERR